MNKIEVKWIEVRCTITIKITDRPFLWMWGDVKFLREVAFWYLIFLVKISMVMFW